MHYNAHAWHKIARQTAATKQNMRCKFCFTPVTFATVTGDHFQSQAKGGSHQSHNIVAACYECNILKGKMSPNQYKKLIRNPPRGAPKSVAFLLAHMRLKVALRAIRACKLIAKVSR